MAGWEKLSRLLTIADWKEDEALEEFQLLFFGAWYPQTFFGFGHPRRKGSYATYLLTDTRNRTDVWVPNKWTQMCLSYRKRDAFLRITVVRRENINYCRAHYMRCINDETPNCSLRTAP